MAATGEAPAESRHYIVQRVRQALAHDERTNELDLTVSVNGDKVFSQIRGEPIGTGSHVTGTITGGTGRYAGVTGEYELRWQYVIETDEGAISGRAVGLKGRVTLPAAGTPRS